MDLKSMEILYFLSFVCFTSPPSPEGDGLTTRVVLGLAIMEAMEALRSANQQGKVTPSSGPSSVHTQPGQGLAALLVMIAVLCFIVAYCCWGAPCCRAFCRRRFCCSNGRTDMEASPSDVGLSVDQGMVATPTIILLPYGRMLVVDGTVFAQLQAETSGLDLIELGENVVRAQQRQGGPRPTLTLNSLADSTPSILEMDSETGSKDGFLLTPSSGNPPPTYDSIFGIVREDLPPAYEEILEQFRAEAERRHGVRVTLVDETTDAEVSQDEMETQSLDEQDLTIEDYHVGEIRESRV